MRLNEMRDAVVNKLIEATVPGARWGQYGKADGGPPSLAHQGPHVTVTYPKKNCTNRRDAENLNVLRIYCRSQLNQ